MEDPFTKSDGFVKTPGTEFRKDKSESYHALYGCREVFTLKGHKYQGSGMFIKNNLS
jgi:hypothetical protein